MASLPACLVTYLLCFASFGLAESAARPQRRANSCKKPVATVKNGSYAGIYSADYDQDFFLGMPYATVSVSRCCSE